MLAAEADVLDRSIRQLRKVGITYDRLLLYDKAQGVAPHRPMRLDIGQVLDEALSEFPRSDLDSIRVTKAPSLPHLRGDPYQLGFVFQTLLSYLLRFLPPDDVVTIDVTADHTTDRPTICVVVRGIVPRWPGGEDPQATSLYLARARWDIALGKRIIERFVEEHQGSFQQDVADGDQVTFRIELPALG
jgi:light-regulated signal transduction histidine kinase (bacteriophytochrome)